MSSSEEALKKQRNLAASVEALENATPLLVRAAESQAAVKRAMFLALIREGFTEQQSIELCKGDR
jgi:hypothetical protein